MNFALNLVALKTIIRKEIVRVLRIWIQTIVPPAITMTLYFIIFGNLIGRRIGTMDGFDYMQYIAPGLIMMSVITNSYGNVVSSFFGAKFGRHIEEMLVSPMSNATIIVGHVAGGVLRGLLVGLLVTIVALFFTRLQVAHPKANPILYMVNAFRYGILGTSDISIANAYAILIVFVVLLFSGCMFLMKRGVGIRE
jgi:ABC-2 type transport system permease protein